jgi:phosphatidylserine/phosphatidylglycerophosphate/cardiolipin synthase-like enzyme
MRRLAASVLGLLLASTTLHLTACALDEDEGEEDLGDIGDGKADSFGIVDKVANISAHKTRYYTFSANASFRIAITQPTTDEGARQTLESKLTRPDGTVDKLTATAEPSFVFDHDVATGKFKLSIKNTGDDTAHLLINVRSMGGFGDLPNPNADVYPEVGWQVPALDTWPNTYVIFNNPGCGTTCAQADASAMAPRAVMIKLLVAAIHEVKDGGIVRVSNYNISTSATVKPVVDALLWAMQTRHATVRITMDEAQNNATSETTLLSQQGAEVRFLAGLSYASSGSSPSVGIMHSKIVAVDDKVVFTGSNNFSSTGFVTNEENAVVLRSTTNASRIAAFTCDIDKMFDIGVAPGQPQPSDAARKDALLALDQCNTADVWFPPTGMTATGDSITFQHVLEAVAGAKRSISIAPDMMANPQLVYALIARSKQAKQAGEPFTIKLVLDASSEALGNPAFGDCLAVSGDKNHLDMQVKYWRGNPDIYQLMHHKFMIIDEDDPSGATLYNGSANYSSRAMSYSFENVTRYRGAAYREIVDTFTARFAKMFEAAKDKAGLAAANVTAPSCPLSAGSL